MTDNNAIMGAAKYTWDPFKFFAGYEYIWQNNPKDPLGVGASDQGGYIMSGVEDNNLDSEKLVQIWWTGVKYAYDSKTDITFAWYQQRQNDFRVPPTCSPAAGFRSSCAGTLDEGSLYTDHHFTKRFDGFAGLAYSFVTGGLAIAIPHGPGVPYLTTTTLLRQSAAVSPSDRFRGGLSREPTWVVVHQGLAAGFESGRRGEARRYNCSRKAGPTELTLTKCVAMARAFSSGQSCCPAFPS